MLFSLGLFLMGSSVYDEIHSRKKQAHYSATNSRADGKDGDNDRHTEAGSGRAGLLTGLAPGRVAK